MTPTDSELRLQAQLTREREQRDAEEVMGRLGLLEEETRTEWDSRLIAVAMTVSPTVEIAHSLLRGESVPTELLSSDWIKKFGRRPGAVISERIMLTDLNTTAAPPVNGNQIPFALTLDAFLGKELESAPPLFGTDEDTIIPTGGLVIIAGLAGVGKTTLALDCVFHLASGRSWLGVPVEQPLNILLLENEGPERKFQQKLQRKRATWEGEMEGVIHIQTWHWGSFTLDDEESAQRLAHYLDFWDIHLVVGDPLDTLGPKGVGSPADTREFVQTLVPLGLTRDRAFLFLHHLRKEESQDEINQVQGAWGGRLDSLMVLKATEDQDRLRLSFPKLRWADERRPMIVGKIRERASFEYVAEEKPREDVPQGAAEEMLLQVIGTLQSRGGMMDRNALALACGVAPNVGTFTRALKLGMSRELLASEKVGRKVNYSLTPLSWDYHEEEK